MICQGMTAVICQGMTLVMPKVLQIHFGFSR